jgi:LAO/AO transport system kinase
VGKSTLVNQLIGAWRRRGKRVAIIAVDPSSPLSGGATLGDRIRMLEHQDDAGVFIRSCASRGRTGGLATTTSGMLHLFDAVGFDIVAVETVGVGQEEIDVVHYVDSVVLVQSPGLGDGVQSLKAGVLEIADIYVVNKSDLPGAQSTAREIKALLGLAECASNWVPPVLNTTAENEQQIEALANAVDEHRAWLSTGNRLTARRAAIARFEINRRAQAILEARLDTNWLTPEIERLENAVAERRCTPSAAAEQLLARVGSSGG